MHFNWLKWVYYAQLNPATEKVGQGQLINTLLIVEQYTPKKKKQEKMYHIKILNVAFIFSCLMIGRVALLLRTYLHHIMLVGPGKDKDKDHQLTDDTTISAITHQIPLSNSIHKWRSRYLDIYTPCFHRSTPTAALSGDGESLSA
jgi:hypothetical protein